MKNETLTLLIVAGVIAGAFYLHQQQKAQGATKIKTPQQNPNQANANVGAANRPVDYVHAGAEALDKIQDFFGGF
jgi:hypothetical protein